MWCSLVFVSLVLLVSCFFSFITFFASVLLILFYFLLEIQTHVTKSICMPSAWSVCECYGPVAVHPPAWGSVQEPRRSLLSPAESRRRSYAGQLSRQERGGHGTYTRAQRETHLWAHYSSYSSYYLFFPQNKQITFFNFCLILVWFWDESGLTHGHLCPL